METDTALRPWLKSYPPGIRWDTPFTGRPLPALLDEARNQYGARPAIDFLGKKWSWEEVAALADRMAKGLQGMGVGKGMRVGLFLPNTLYSVVAYYAVLKTGATVVNFNPLYAP